MIMKRTSGSQAIVKTCTCELIMIQYWETFYFQSWTICKRKLSWIEAEVLPSYCYSMYLCILLRCCINNELTNNFAWFEEPLVEKIQFWKAWNAWTFEEKQVLIFSTWGDGEEKDSKDLQKVSVTGVLQSIHYNIRGCSSILWLCS